MSSSGLDERMNATADVRMLRDRREAERALAEAVRSLRLPDPVVLALPLGGVPAGYRWRARLDAPLDVLLARPTPPRAGSAGRIDRGGRIAALPGGRDRLPRGAVDARDDARVEIIDRGRIGPNEMMSVNAVRVLVGTTDPGRGLPARGTALARDDSRGERT